MLISSLSTFYYQAKNSQSLFTYRCILSLSLHLSEWKICIFWLLTTEVSMLRVSTTETRIFRDNVHSRRIEEPLATRSLVIRWQHFINWNMASLPKLTRTGESKSVCVLDCSLLWFSEYATGDGWNISARKLTELEHHDVSTTSCHHCQMKLIRN